MSVEDSFGKILMRCVTYVHDCGLRLGRHDEIWMVDVAHEVDGISELFVDQDWNLYSGRGAPMNSSIAVLLTSHSLTIPRSTRSSIVHRRYLTSYVRRQAEKNIRDVRIR
jgi:hypothetical protein